jgi:2-keto-4-pentenoate hydratase/2-oxohepta-3-ene-1,7-dioic acid hydratase in catechol pathway
MLSPLKFDRTTPKLVFLARSFGRHALELGNEVPKRPLYFLKAPSSLLPSGGCVTLHEECDVVHYEAEVAVIIGRPLSKATLEEAQQAISAWTVLNDVTARSVQAEDGGKFTRAKGYDSFCPIADEQLEILDWRDARIQGWLNGICVQDAPLTDMIFTPAEAIASISSVMTLNPGDLVSLGTPSGVGRLKAGDTFEVRLCQNRADDDSSLHHPTLLSFSHGVISS